MKNVLFIAMDIGSTSPGIVYEKLLRQMINKIKCTIICPSINTIEPFDTLPSPPYKRLPFRVENFLNTVFGTNILDIIWSRRIYKQIRINTINKIDCIVSLVSSGNYAPILAGAKVSSRYNKPWLIYTVDAIPTPVAWNHNPRQNKAISIFLKTFISHASGLYAANPMMLSYVQSIFSYSYGKTGVIYTPRDFVPIQPVKIQHEGIVFLYTGTVYGVRKIDNLLMAFRAFLEIDCKSKLIFVGKVFSDALNKYQDLLISGNIEIHSFTNSLNEFYRRADILLDIGADVDNDVFLSSKIVNYLAYKKPIIAITQDGSPARAIFKDAQTILHCHHNCNEIVESMKKSVLLLDTSFEDRDKYMKEFSAEYVAKRFIDEINSNWD